MQKIVEKNKPILITGADRSGSSFIARIVHMCGAYSGIVNKMYENEFLSALSKKYIDEYSKQTQPFPTFDAVSTQWKTQVLEWANVRDVWMFKSSFITPMWRIWDYAFPQARWIIVRRRTGDILNSCLKTGYMTLFKDPAIRECVGANDEREAWLWWVHQYEDAWKAMIRKGVDYMTVWPERMADGDYAQLHEMIEWLGLEWNDNIPMKVGSLLIKRKETNDDK